jgi:hypothetical protein
MLDQNRWTSVGIANALLEDILARVAGFPELPATRRLNFGLNGHSIECRGSDFQMKLSFVVPLLVAASFAAYAQQAMPRMVSVDPPNGKKGDVIAITGENLQKDLVSKVYLTDGKNDLVVEVTEQTDTSIKFKIPEKAAAGRLALMILTTGKDAKYIEQPVKLTIDSN